MRALWLSLTLLAVLPGRAAAAGASDPARGHYLLAPSAFLLHGGEVVVSQTEAFLSSAGVGIADHLEVNIGSAVPALSLAGANTFNVSVALKGGSSFGPLLHVAAGFQTLSFPGVTAGFTYGVVTVGRERLNVSLGGGYPVAAIRGSPSFGDPMAFAAGVVGLGRHVALASENWWFPTLGRLGLINAGLVRFDVWRLSLGMGAARIDPLRIPLPWMELSVRLFG